MSNMPTSQGWTQETFGTPLALASLRMEVEPYYYGICDRTP